MRSTTGTRRRRTRVALLTALSTAVLGLVALAPAPASANLPGSTFEGNDGNMVVDHSGNTDWSNVGGVNTGIDLPSGTSDNAFAQGTKEDNTAVTVSLGSIPPNKNDLTRFYEASQLGSNGHNYLELAWERAVNIGNANLDFEINQHTTAGFTGSTVGPVTLNRTAGDLLVTYDFSGSGNPTLGLNFWLTAAAGNTPGQCLASSTLPCWGLHETLGSSTAEGAVNTVGIIDPLNGNAPLGVGLFGETAIDLTAAGVFPPGTCEAFGSAFVKSRSSSSFSAELKDFIAPIGVNIANCGNIIIRKVTQQGDSTFGYTTTGGLTPSTFNLSNGGVQNYGGTVRPGTYSVTENLTAAQIAAGWTQVSLTCKPAVGTGTSFTTSGSTVNITLAGSGVVDCTYTNHIPVTPSITTSLSATTVNIGDSVHDSSTLSGASATAGGTVTYHAYAGQNVCTGTDLLNSQVTVTNGVVPNSASLSFSSAGYYSFQAVYSGDFNNRGATSVCSTEVLLVKANPSIATTLSATTISLGDSVHDSSALTGASSDAGGTVTYHAYAGQNTCTGTDLLNSQVTVTNGVVPDSATVTLTAAGYYSFQAVYSGDLKNNGATSVCSTELLLVKANPTIATTLSATSANIGDNVHDSATLSQATADAGGTVTYHAYAGQDICTGTDLLNSQVTVTNGVVPNSAPVSFSAAGYYSFQAVYSGDLKNNGATSDCSTELLLVRTNPSIATTLSSTTISLGGSVHDSSALTGATSDAGGTVTYHAYAGQNVCTGTDLLNSQVTVTNGVVPDSATLTPAAAGYYSFQAVYSGDVKNNPATSVCSTELLLVKANPSIATTLSSTSANIGDNIHDSSTLSAVTSDAGGTVTYHAYAGQDICTGTDLLNSQVTVTNGVVPDSASVSFSAAGFYSFQAVYSGDVKNNGATSDCSTELLLVRTNPTIATTLSATSVQVGTAVSDTAMLSGETADVSGTITFTVYTDNACTAGGQFAGMVSASTGVVPSNSITFNVAGTFYWQAVYSGDTKNNPATSVCTSEQLVVNPAQPGVSTAQNLIPNDSFTLSGGFNPTGSITMSLFAPSDATCSGPPALTQTVTVSGNGTYSTSNTTFIATAEGTWRWASTYGGDHNNLPATSSCGTEQFTIANH